MNQTLSTFDITSLLDSEQAISEYLFQVLAANDNEEIARAIKYVAEACLVHFREASLTTTKT